MEVPAPPGAGSAAGCCEQVRAAHHVGDALVRHRRPRRRADRHGGRRVGAARTRRSRCATLRVLRTEAPIVEVDDPIRQRAIARRPCPRRPGSADRRVEQLVCLFLRPAGRARRAGCGCSRSPQVSPSCAQSIERRVIVRWHACSGAGSARPTRSRIDPESEMICRRAGPLTRRVEILDAHQPAATAAYGLEVAADGREQRAEMERPVGLGAKRPQYPRAGSAVPVVPVAVLLLATFAALLRLDAQGRHRTRFETLDADRLAGLEAVAVAAVLDALQRFVDLADQLALAIARAQFEAELGFLRRAVVRDRESWPPRPSCAARCGRLPASGPASSW